MHYLQCSYGQLLELPQDYVEIINEIAERQAAKQRAHRLGISDE